MHLESENRNMGLHNNMFTLPKGWVWVRLGEVTEILDNKRIPVNADERKKEFWVNLIQN